MYVRCISILVALLLLTSNAAKSEVTKLYSSSPSSSSSDSAIPYKDIRLFTSAYAQIKNYYVDDVPTQKLFEDAIRGMLSGLDPHSAYLDEEEFQDLRLNTSGQFSGIGIEIITEDGFLKVITPLDGSPAAKAGIKPKDYIIRIDQVPVKGMTLREAIKKMRGSDGSKITLTILRENRKDAFDVSIRRAKIMVQSIKSKILEPGYGYIRVSQFQSHTPEEFKAALSQLNEKAGGKLKGLILDLRNNPGGLLESAVKISNTLLDHQSLTPHLNNIVFTKGRNPSTEFAIKAKPENSLTGSPIVVLINEGSASASEIVAGALQDYKRAILVGTPSFGKGSVQTVIPLDDKRGIKLTTALYYTPSGHSIQAEGIQPDIIVEDLKFEKNKDAESSIAQRVTEANLNRHFNNQKAVSEIIHKGNLLMQTKDLPLDSDLSKEEEKLAVTDYQLFEGLNLLKALSIVK